MGEWCREREGLVGWWMLLWVLGMEMIVVWSGAVC